MLQVIQLWSDRTRERRHPLQLVAMLTPPLCIPSSLPTVFPPLRTSSEDQRTSLKMERQAYDVIMDWVFRKSKLDLGAWDTKFPSSQELGREPKQQTAGPGVLS